MNLEINLNEREAKEFLELCNDFDLTQEEAIENLIDLAIRKWTLPSGEYLPNGETIKAIEEAEEMLKSGNYKTYSSWAELEADILKRDNDDE